MRDICHIPVHESLITYIKNHSTTPLTEDNIKAIKDVFVPKTLRKHHYLLQEGEVCKHTAFIVNGSMRKYQVDNKGVENIIMLYLENSWVFDRESYITETPSIYNIDAWENTELLLFTKTNQTTRLSSIAALQEARRMMDNNFAIAAQKRMASISLTAEERYDQLLKTYPEFLQRFPQHVIASYLGIAKETLSRIRRHAAKK